jgi:hypothetical protein
MARFLVEVEAEKMVLVTNRMFNLGIDEEQYIAEANEIFATAYYMSEVSWA